MMKIRLYNIEVFERIDLKSYKKLGQVNILGGNIIPIEGCKLPGNNDAAVNLTYVFSDSYIYFSEGLINTHLDYPYGGNYKKNNKEGNCRIYAKFSWWQRQKLSYINNQSWFHKHPIATVALIVNVIAGLINIVVGFINYRNNLESCYQTVIKEQNQILRKQIELLKEENEIKNKPDVKSSDGKTILIDSLTSK